MTCHRVSLLRIKIHTLLREIFGFSSRRASSRAGGESPASDSVRGCGVDGVSDYVYLRSALALGQHNPAELSSDRTVSANMAPRRNTEQDEAERCGLSVRHESTVTAGTAPAFSKHVSCVIPCEAKKTKRKS